MPESDYRYAIKLIGADGADLETVPTEVDWSPAFEWALFEGMREGKLPARAPFGASTVLPAWHERLRRPYVGAFAVRVTGRDGDVESSHEVTIPLEYLTEAAQRAGTDAYKRGRMKSKLFRYHVLAYPGNGAEDAGPGDARGFTVVDVAQPVPLRDAEMRSFMESAVAFDDPDAAEVPVFFPRGILNEMARLTRAAAPKEVGGILLGHLHRDPASGEIFIEVTAQVQAREAQSELTKLTFTAETWTAVRAAIDLRRRDELIMGWWHCHSFLQETCKDCEKYKNRTCSASAAFMSSQDCALHRTIFPRAYSLSVVLSDSPCGGLSWKLFGWKQGRVLPRGFYVLEAGVRATSEEVENAARE
jgi:hypothetical protein